MREISDALRGLARLRKKTGVSIEEIQKRLVDEYDINAAVKTIYGWESGKVQPSIKTFIALCQIYKIKDIYKFLDDTEEITERAIKDDKLIKNYYKNVEFQSAIDKLLSL